MQPVAGVVGTVRISIFLTPEFLLLVVAVQKPVKVSGVLLCSTVATVELNVQTVNFSDIAKRGQGL